MENTNTIARIKCDSVHEAIARARKIFEERPDTDWVLCEGRATVGGVFYFWNGDLLLHRSERGRWIGGGETVEEAQAALLSH